jgi:voltage-gated potassium channel
MDRHYKIIFEAILSILILLELLFLILISIGFVAGITSTSVYTFGIWDVAIGILIIFDLVFFRIIKGDQGKENFLRNNWAFIIAGIPLYFISFNLLQLFDINIIIALIGIIRLFALIKVLQTTSQGVRRYPQKTKLDYATVILFLILILGSYIFYLVEKGVNPTVTSYDSAIWYSIVSMTTTGYGDIVPVTAIGHIIGVIVILTGMSYVSLVTATLAYSFIDLFRKESRKAIEKVGKNTDGFRTRFDNYEEKLDKILERMDEIEKKIDENKK